MNRTTKPRLGIGVLLLSLVLAPVFAAPSMAQETDGLHFVTELPDGSGMEGEPLEVGLDTWWQRHDTAYQPGTYEIVDDPVNEGSAHSLHLAIDAEVADPEDHARVISYFKAAERPDLREFFESGLGYTLYVDEATNVNASTQLVVEAFYGWDGDSPRFTTLSLMPGANGLELDQWQTFDWSGDTVTLSTAAGATDSLDNWLTEIYSQASEDQDTYPDDALDPVAIGVGLNLGTDPGVTVSSYVDQVTLGDQTYKFGEDPRPTLTGWPEEAARGDTVTVTGTNLADVTVELNGAGEVEATWDDDGTELSFVVPDDAALGDRHVRISNDYGQTQFILRVVAAPESEPHPGFTDVPEDHLFHGEILWLAQHDITRGCNPPANDQFCPDDSITRGQMAAFIVRALDLPPADEDGFVDDGHSIFEGDLNATKAADIFRGCNPPTNDRACPDDPISRGEMAAVIVRALDLPAGEDDAFTDDDLSVFEGDIDALAAADVTRGCNPPVNDQFCPDRDITRGEMAAFLFRALSDVLDDSDG
ncbi:MAG TPA: S-layer homology domain-containing protein, partial [Acidimicrobiia bacterium]|nr:S-layer homology domain-containing protein [Acidimicrobiia bacterium]